MSRAKIRMSKDKTKQALAFDNKQFENSNGTTKLYVNI